MVRARDSSRRNVILHIVTGSVEANRGGASYARSGGGLFYFSFTLAMSTASSRRYKSLSNSGCWLDTARRSRDRSSCCAGTFLTKKMRLGTRDRALVREMRGSHTASPRRALREWVRTELAHHGDHLAVRKVSLQELTLRIHVVHVIQDRVETWIHALASCHNAHVSKTMHQRTKHAGVAVDTRTFTLSGQVLYCRPSKQFS
jgi:hypothetical protein